MIDLFIKIFAAYIITAVLVNGNIFYSVREFLKSKSPWLVKGNPGRHMLDCRMCVGLWVSLAISVTFDWQMFFLIYGVGFWAALAASVTFNGQMFFLIYGVSYFLATQENINNKGEKS